MKRTKYLPLACAFLFTGSVLALEIEVAPKTLVLSSKSGKLTVHTDAPYHPDADVVLVVDGTVVEDVVTFADKCGNLVVQCSKEAAAAAIRPFKGKTTIVTVTLVVNGQEDSVSLRVKK